VQDQIYSLQTHYLKVWDDFRTERKIVRNSKIHLRIS